MSKIDYGQYCTFKAKNVRVLKLSMNKTLTAAQAAQKLGVSLKTLRRWETKGVLKPLRTEGNHRRYNTQDVVKFYEKLQRKQAKKTQDIEVSENVELLDIKQAAIKLGVTTKTLRRWEEKGALIPVRTEGNHRRYSIDDLKALVNKPTIKQVEEQVEEAAIEEVEQDKFVASVDEPIAKVERSVPAFSDILTADDEIRSETVYKKSSVGRSIMISSVTVASTFATILILVFAAQIITTSDSNQGLVGKGASLISQKTKEAEKVLGMSTADIFSYKFNVPVNIGGIATFEEAADFLGDVNITGLLTASGGIDTNNADINIGTGQIIGLDVITGITAGTGIAVTAGNNPEVSNTGVISLQGSTGAVTLTAGSGISISGTTISNSSPGPGNVNSFANIVSGSDTITASSGNDTLTFEAGTGITITPDTGTKTLTFTASGGTGDVVGPASSTDNAIARFDGTTGKLIQNSQVLISDAGLITGGVWNGTLISTQYGGTGVDFSAIVQGSVPYFNGLGTMAALAPGTAGQCLSSNGPAANITWTDCVAGQNYWQMNSGLISPFSNTADVAFGGTSSASAKFAFLNNVSGTPTASISANSGANNTFLTGTGNLGTTNMQTLTLGGSTTGNITVSNLTSFNAGATIVSGQNFTLAGITGNNAALFATSGSGIVAAATTNSSNLCLVSGASAPSWSNCAAAASDDWDISNGAIYPKLASTLDLLLGSDATASSKFAFMNVNSGTPIASISANSGANSTFLTGSGFLSTTNRQTITIGNSSTFNSSGNTVINPNGIGVVGIGTAAPIYTLHVNSTTDPRVAIQNPNSGGITWGLISATSAIHGTPNGSFLFWDGTDNVFTLDSTNNRAGVFSTAPDRALEVNSATGINLRLTYNDTTGSATNYTDFTLASDGDLTIDSSGSNITLADTLTFSNYTSNGGVLYTNGSGVVAQVTAGTSSQCLLGGTTPSFGSCSTGQDAFWNQQNGLLFPNNSTVDFAIGGQATTSAKFAVLNVNSGIPTASVSGNLIAAMTPTGTGGKALIGAKSFSSSERLKVSGLQDQDVWLHVSGSDNGTTVENLSMVLGVLGGGTDTGFVGTSTNHTLTLRTNNTDRVAVDTSGNLLINTTSSSLGYRALSIYGDGKSMLFNSASTNPASRMSIEFCEACSGVTTSSMAIEYNGLGATTANKIHITGAGSDLVTFTRGGNVGIGDTDPDEMFIVTDQSIFGGTTAAAGAEPIEAQGAGAGYSLYDRVGGSSERWVMYSTRTGGAGTNTLRFYTGGDRFTIGPTGNLGATGTITGLTGITSSGTITLSAFTSNGGPLYTNGSGVVAQVTAGSSTQCLLGGTTPFFGSCATGSDAFWQQSAGGLLFPNNATVDLAIGGSSTASAKFAFINVNTGTPTASISANSGANATTLTGTGVLGTTNMQTLTLGDSTTGSIKLANSAFGASTGNNAVLYAGSGTGILSAATTNSSSLCLVSGASAPSWASCSGVAGSLWDQSNGAIYPKYASTVDLLLGSSATASAKFGFLNVNSGTPVASISANSGANNTFLTGLGNLATTNMQTLTIGSSTTGNILIDSGTGLVQIVDGTTQLTASGADIDFTGGGTNSIVSSGTLLFDSDAINFNNGGTSVVSDIVPAINDSYSLGSSSFSWSTLYVNDIQGLASANLDIIPGSNRDVVIGGASNTLTYFKSNGQVGIGTGSSPTSQLHVTRPLSAGALGKALAIFDQIEDQDVFTASKSGATVFTVTSIGTLLPGTNDTSDIGSDTLRYKDLYLGGETLHIGTNTSDEGTLSYTTSSNTLALDGIGPINIGNTAGTTITLGRSGQGITLPGFTGQNGVLYGTSGTGVLAQATTSSSNLCLVSGASAPTWTNCSAASSNYWQLNNNALSPANSTYDVLFGATSTASARFAFINNTGSSSVPTASISANSGANNTFLTGAGNLATTNRQTLTLGGSTTGLINVLSQAGNIFATFDTLNSGLTLGLAGSTNGLLSFASSGVGETAPTITSESDGDLAIAASTGSVNIGNGSGDINLTPGTNNIVANLASTGDFLIQDNGTTYVAFTDSALVGIGTSSPISALHVTHPLNLVATGKALAIFDQIENQDILTASKSGTTMFTVESTGTVDIATGATYQINNTNVLSATTLGSGVINSSLQTLGTISTGVWNGTVIGTQYGGTGNNWSATAQGSLPYFNGTGTMAALAPGVVNQCLITGGAGANPSWSSCSTGQDAYWNQQNGALFPNNSTVDFLVGGQATSSANFAVLNNNSGIPVSSVSGNLVVMPKLGGGARVLVGTPTSLVGEGNAKLTVNIGGETGGILLSGTNSPEIYINDPGSSGFARLGISSTAGQISANSLADAVVLANDEGALQFGTGTSGSSVRMTLDTGGNVGIGTTSITSPGGFTKTLQVRDSSSASVVVDSNGTSRAEFGVSGSGGWLSTADNIAFRFATNGSEKMRIAANGLLGVGTASPISELHVTRALSQGATGKALAIFDQIESQDIFAASASGTTRFVIQNNGDVGINNALPDTALHVVGTIRVQPDASWSSGDTALIQLGDGASYVSGGFDTASVFNGNAGLTLSTGNDGNLVLSPDDAGIIQVNKNVVPNTDDAVDLGTNTLRFRDLYLGGETLHIGTSTTDETSISYTTSSNTLAINNTASGIINIGTSALAQTITLGNNTGATALNLTSGTGAQTFTSSVATGTTTASAFVFTANSLTTGTALNISSTSLTSGRLVNIAPTYTSGLTGYGLYIDGTDTGANAGVDYGIRVVINNSGAAGKTVAGIRSGPITASTNSGTDSVYGFFSSPSGSHNTDAGAINTYGLFVGNDSSASTNGTSAQYGIYIDPLSGADTNVALCFDCDGVWSQNTVGSGIQFGTDANLVNLYRSGSDSLKTDDSLSVGNTTGQFVGFQSNNAMIWNSSLGPFLSSTFALAMQIDTDNDHTNAYFGVYRDSNTHSGGTNLLMLQENGLMGLGTSTPTSQLHVTRPLSLGASGKAVAIFDQIESQDIFTASASGTTRFTIANSGNVGMGTTPTSTQKLAIIATNSTNGISILENSTEAMLLGYDVSNNRGVIGSYNGGTLGNLEIQEAGPTSVYFSTYGTSFAGIGFNSTLSGTGNYALLGSSTDTFLNTPSGDIYLRDGNSTIANSTTGHYVCYNTGTTGSISYGATCASSAERFKNTIIPLTEADGLEAVLALNPVSFKYNPDKDPDGLGRTYVGFVAEDVEQVDPRLVIYGSDGQTQSVHYENMTALLTKAIQQLNNKVEVIEDGIFSPETIEATTADFTNLTVETANAQSISTDNLSASTITADSLVINQDIEVMGTIYADKIVANEIEGLAYFMAGQGSLESTASANLKYSVLQADIASTSARIDGIEDLLASVNFEGFASSSANLTMIDNLMVAGSTTLSDLAVVNSISVGNNLTIGVNSIETIGSDLEVQPLAQGNVNFFGGKVNFDTEGNIKIEGNAEFAKDVKVGGVLSAKDIRIPKGSIVNDSATVATASSSAGISYIEAGELERRINLASVKADSVVVVTPNSSTGGEQLYVKEKGNGYFTVGIDNSLIADLEFNFVVVGQ